MLESMKYYESDRTAPTSFPLGYGSGGHSAENDSAQVNVNRNNGLTLRYAPKLHVEIGFLLEKLPLLSCNP